MASPENERFTSYFSAHRQMYDPNRFFRIIIPLRKNFANIYWLYLSAPHPTYFEAPFRTRNRLRTL